MSPERFVIEAFVVIVAINLVIKIVSIIKHRKSLKSCVPILMLFIVLLGVLVSMNLRRHRTAQHFLGSYKLLQLDGRECSSCRIKLTHDYEYNIYVRDEKVGKGMWSLDFSGDLPGYFLVLEDGSEGIMEITEYKSDANRVISSIDRR